jgi:translation initiation factor 4G
MPRLDDQMHSRPGSRRGQPRDNFGAPAVDANGWSVPTPQRPAKAGDLTGFGKAIRSSGPTLGGPSGHFAKGAKAKEAVRPSTPSNAFAALEALDSPAASTTPQRQRIILAPRTIPKEGMEIETTDETVEAPVEEEAAGEEEEEEDDDGAIDPNAVSMSRAEGERRAGNSVKVYSTLRAFLFDDLLTSVCPTGILRCQIVIGGNRFSGSLTR